MHNNALDTEKRTVKHQNLKYCNCKCANSHVHNQLLWWVCTTRRPRALLVSASRKEQETASVVCCLFQHGRSCSVQCLSTKWKSVVRCVYVFFSYATVFTAQCYARHILCCCKISVICLSVPACKLFSTSDSYTILVFPHQTLWQYFNGDPTNGSTECRPLQGVCKIMIFDQYLAFSRKPYKIEPLLL